MTPRSSLFPMVALTISFAAVACGESDSDDDNGSSQTTVGSGVPSGSNTGSTTGTNAGSTSGTTNGQSTGTTTGNTTGTTNTGTSATGGGTSNAPTAGDGSCAAPPCTPPGDTTSGAGGAGGSAGMGAGGSTGMAAGAGGGDTMGAGGDGPMGPGDDNPMGAGGGATDDNMMPDDDTPTDDEMPTDDGMMASGERGEGPCDIYNDAGNECVAAYSTIRSLREDYTGPLYQVRSGSNAMNTGSGGEVHDIPQLANGFADAAAQDEVCAGTTCTISLMYDHSGRENHLPVAKRGLAGGGEWADDDDFESIADAGPLMVNGNNVYSLYMEARQGYRQTSPGDGMARGQEPQAIYMLADGTHSGSACCWDFGNVTPDPTVYHTMNTLFLGQAYWGRGAGSGPWFMADFEAGVWAGGSNPGEPGWGALSDPAPANEANPSLRVPFAIGFLKTDRDYALRMADLMADSALTTAYEGPLPKSMDNQGAVVIGVGGDNSNNSWGTFFEGAIVLGYPSDETEQAVMDNVKNAGYGM